MAGFLNLPKKSNKSSDGKIIRKLNNTRASNTVTSRGSGSGTLQEKIALINATVEKAFPDKTKYIMITTPEALISYVDKIISQGICALDTETTNLEPITCTIAGFSLHVEGQKAAYIPLHHVSYVTGTEVDNQLDEEFAIEQLNRLKDSNTKIIMHNAQFDIRVIKHQLGIDFSDTIYWDTQVASHLLNENEEHSLKGLWNKYCNGGRDGKLDYSSLFHSIGFNYIPLKTAYLYAAKDALITFELYKFQRQFLDGNYKSCEQRGLYKVAKLFRDIEMPLISVVVDMEDTGVCIDTGYAQQLSVDYTLILKQRHKVFDDLCAEHSTEIEKFKATHPKHGLEKRINTGSPQQIATLLYDILGLKSPDKRKPRGTGEKILEQLKSPFVKAILDCRETEKLLGTYIDKLPRVLNPKTNRIHADFNQNGAKTGRFSSSDPNLQNIPSHDKKIRKMFIPSVGHYLISCDFSQQEPRILAHFSQDDKLIQAYAEGRDIYAFMGSEVYKIPYEDCLEKFPDGTSNPEGKKRRDAMKAIVLGIMYGRETKSIAEGLKITIKEAERIKNVFFIAFPKVKIWVDGVLETAKKTGYVETAWGRKRRLHDLTLPLYEFSYMDGHNKNFDLLDFDSDIAEDSNEVEEDVINEYWDLLEKSRGWKDMALIKDKAKEEGIIIKDNSRIIADAERQAMNSPIQGSAGDMIKNAMVLVNSNKEFRELGGKMIIQVHDELIIEAPIENIFKVAKLASSIMIDSAKSVISVPMKCDVDVLERWYGEKVKEVA